MAVALQKLLNPYFGEILNFFVFSLLFKRFSDFRGVYCWLRLFLQGGRVKNCCYLSSKLSMHPSHCLASVWIRQNCLCGPDRPETRRWVDRHWLLWSFHLQELERYTLYNKATKRSNVQQQAAKQQGDCTVEADCAALMNEQASAWLL